MFGFIPEAVTSGLIQRFWWVQTKGEFGLVLDWRVQTAAGHSGTYSKGGLFWIPVEPVL